MSSTPIHGIYDEATRLSTLLLRSGEVSLELSTKSHFRKILLLSIASWFEFRLSAAVLKFAEVHSDNHAGLVSIVRIRAISRQYHSWFEWPKQNAGKFYGMFGECGSVLKSAVKADDQLQAGERAFLELGDLRNQLVHENFATFPLEKTAEDVYSLYTQAEMYVSWIETQLTSSVFGRRPVA